jgi:hypothetical protein
MHCAVCCGSLSGLVFMSELLWAGLCLKIRPNVIQIRYTLYETEPVSETLFSLV